MEIEPGIYRDVPDKTYRAWDRVSQTKLKEIHRSPLHATMQKQIAKGPFGSAGHMMLFQAQEAQENVIILPLLDLRRSKDKQLRADIAEANQGKIILTYEEGLALNQMIAAVRANKTASDLLEAIVDVELSVAFDWLGVGCKARLDAVTKDNIIVDLKTTMDASPSGFARSVAKFGYACQDAMYRQALEAHDIEPQKFIFIAVENTPPYGVACYQLDKAARNYGRTRIERALETYALCQKYQAFPSYPDQITTLKLPTWALKDASVGDAEEW